MNSMFQSIISMPPPFNMIVIIMLIVFITGLITSLAKQVRKYACHRHEIEFKRDMLDRGITIEEIERVVQARPNEPSNA